MKQLRKQLLYIGLLLLSTVLIWTIWGNTALVLTHCAVRSEKLPPAFQGFTIAQVSDLHNTQFGTDNQKLLAMLKNARPDMIAITGDLLDSRNTDPETVIAFVTEAVTIAPVYYIPGNHESRIPNVYAEVKQVLTTLGVVILENRSIILEQDGQQLCLTGLTDPVFNIPWPDLTSEAYQVVLSHRPELIDLYAQSGFDLVLTGHAHGGQFRLPFIGGLYAPHQGFLPEYDSGIHKQGDTVMVVSRGLGNSLFPLRFNNRPELILITLESI